LYRAVHVVLYHPALATQHPRSSILSIGEPAEQRPAQHCTYTSCVIAPLRMRGTAGRDVTPTSAEEGLLALHFKHEGTVENDDNSRPRPAAESRNEAGRRQRMRYDARVSITCLIDGTKNKAN
jgi:hypothetical protein